MKQIIILATIVFIAGNFFSQSIEHFEGRIQALNKTVKIAEDSIEIYKQEIQHIKNEELKKKMLSNEIPVVLYKGAKMKDTSNVFGKVIFEPKSDIEGVALNWSEGSFYICVDNNCGYVNEVWIKGMSEELKTLQNMKSEEEEVERQKRIKIEVEKNAKNKIDYEKKQEATAKELFDSFAKKYGESKAQKLKDGTIWIGCTKEMVIYSWGEPEDINTTITVYSKREQWVYNLGSYVYFEDGKVTTIQD